MKNMSTAIFQKMDARVGSLAPLKASPIVWAVFDADSSVIHQN